MMNFKKLVGHKNGLYKRSANFRIPHLIFNLHNGDQIVGQPGKIIVLDATFRPAANVDHFTSCSKMVGDNIAGRLTGDHRLFDDVDKVLPNVNVES